MTTRRQILEAAIDLFSRQGYSGTSVRQITGAVGMKESILYNYFDSKEALFNAILEYLESEFDSRALPESALAQQIAVTSPKAFMELTLQRFLDFWQSSLHMKLWLVVSMEQYRNERAGMLILKETTRIRHMTTVALRTMHNQGKIRSGNLESLADAFVSALRAMQLDYALLSVMGKDTRPTRKRMDSFITFFASLISSKE